MAVRMMSGSHHAWMVLSARPHSSHAAVRRLRPHHRRRQSGRQGAQDLRAPRQRRRRRGLLAGDPTDIAHLFFAFIEGMAAAESAQRLGASTQSVNRRWRLGLDALINGLSPGGGGAGRLLSSCPYSPWITDLRLAGVRAGR
jgi:hypothetical protein